MAAWGTPKGSDRPVWFWIMLALVYAAALLGALYYGTHHG